MVPKQNETDRRLVELLKRIYRAHMQGDQSTGWDELGAQMADELCNQMGHEEFTVWLEEPT